MFLRATSGLVPRKRWVALGQTFCTIVSVGLLVVADGRAWADSPSGSLISDGTHRPTADPLLARIALVVANTYTGGSKNAAHWPVLSSTTADAERIKSALVSQDFELVGGDVQVDVTRQRLMTLVQETRRMADARPGAIVLVYYSGHGFGLDGHDYLVPSDAAAPDGELNGDAGFAVSDLLAALDRRDHGVNLVFLDACRSIEGKNPQFGALVGERHLPTRSFVGSATTYGSTVYADPNGQQASAFANGLADAIDNARPIDSLESVYYQATREVVNGTGFQQRPVSRAGVGFDATTFAPFRGHEDPSSSALVAEASVEVVARYAYRRCVLPLVLNNSKMGPAHDATSIEARRGDIAACLLRLASERPDLGAKFAAFRFQDADVASSFAQAVEDGDADATFLVGMNDFNIASEHTRFFKPRRPGDALEAPDDRTRAAGWDNVLRAANQGSTSAALFAGTVLTFGLPASSRSSFPPRDPRAGAAWLERAEKAGDGDASALLAIALMTDSGLPRDALSARRHVRLATARTASLDFPQLELAPLLVGLDCAYGQDGPKDAACANELLSWVVDRSKARLPNGRAAAGLAGVAMMQMMEVPRPGDVIAKLPTNDVAIRYYLERALADGDPDAHYYNGLFHDRGQHGYPTDHRMALDEYRIAAAQGSAAAQNMLQKLTGK